MNNTRKFSKLSYREMGQLPDILIEWIKQSHKIPKGVNKESSEWKFNPNSAGMFFVDEKMFLEDKNSNILMLNTENKPETWLVPPSGRVKGFYNDLLNGYEYMDAEDKKWLDGLKQKEVIENG